MQEELVRTAMQKAEDISCPPESLTDEECAALSAHVAARLSETGLTDEEYSQCVRIQRLIAMRAQQLHGSSNSLDPEAARRRTNWMLRNAIEKTRQGRPQELTEHEVNLVENTLRGLTAMSEPSDNHRRLQEILEQALDVYYTYYAESVTPAQTAVAPRVNLSAAPVAPKPVPSSGIPVETFFQGGQKRKMEYLGAITLNQNLYYYEHEGDLHLTGDIPKDYFLEVRGALRIDGSVSGVVLADRGVEISGDISGGAILTFHENIKAGRVLAASRLIAPRGSLRCHSVDRAATLFCAGGLQVSGDIHESMVYCSSAQIEGLLTRATLHVLDDAKVMGVSGEGSRGSRVEFRAAHSSIDYCGTIESQDAQTIKEYVRARFDVELITATQSIFEKEYASFLQCMLYLMQGGVSVETSLVAVRELELTWALLGVAEVAGSELMLAVRRAIELPGVPDLTVLSPALDVCQRAIRFLKAEAEGLPQDLVPQRRQRLSSAVGHLSNYAKQVRDAGAGGGDLAATYFPLRDRCAEWHAEREEALQSLPAARGPLVDTIGPAAANEKSIDALNQLVRKAQDASSQRSRLMPSMKKLLDHYVQSYSKWGAGLAEARQRLAQSEAVLRDSGAAQFAGKTTQSLRVGEGGISAGSLLRAASFADTASASHKGALLLVAEPIPGEASFSVLSGGIVCK